MPETVLQAKERIGLALAEEVKLWQQHGMPDAVIGLKIYGRLIDAQLELEQNKLVIARLDAMLGKEITSIVAASKSC